MGMFDTIYSAYPVFGCPYDQELQTKDLESVMLQFTINPAGQLYEINTQGTWDMQEIPPEERKGLATFKAIPNGNRGRLIMYPVTDTLLVYPAKYYGNYQRMPCALLTFIDGMLISIHRDTAAGMRNNDRYPVP